MSAQELVANVRTMEGQALGVLLAAVFWMIFIQAITGPLIRWVKAAEWWSRALPNQKNVMVNFGYVEEDITEDSAAWAFVWIITMCITHVVSALLMFPVFAGGWTGVGPIGQFCFLCGVLSEVGFDVYDWLRNAALCFLHPCSSFLGPKFPFKTFFLICILHHTTVLALAVPMAIKYADMRTFHIIGFSLLFSAGVCYLSGQYKFTVDAQSKQGLYTCKAIVTFQFVMNWLTRVFIWLPACYHTLKNFHTLNDTGFFYGGCAGMLGMTLYNLVIAADATMAATKWWKKAYTGDDLLSQ